MKMKSLRIIIWLVFSVAFIERGYEAQNLNMAKLNWIDLTYPFSAETLYWPNNPTGFRLDTMFAGKTDKGYYYSSYSICAPEHGGTHLDAPVHFAEGKKTVDQLTLDQLTGDAVVIDVSEKALRDRDYLIRTEDVLEWEKAHGALEPNTIVLFRTGYGKFYPDPLTYFGTALKGDAAIPDLHFPGVSQELALWLTKSRKVKAVGIDTPSIDFGQSKNFHAHQILLKDNIPVFENVANLHLLKERGTYIIALPMLIEQGSGGPLRIIAGIQN